MRTTVTLAKDVSAAVDRLRRGEGIGVSEAVNRLARAGLASGGAVRQAPFRQRSARLGAFAVDVANVGEALELAEGEDHR
jgi:hypothetical protein